MNIESVIGKVIKSQRIRLEINQEELAFRSHSERTYISMIERGLSQPTVGKMFDISKALKIRPSDFIRMVEVEYDKALNEKDK
ncbi:MAG: helix-turn-helix transcriptional regulator [Paenibacillaceae bacterium]